MLQQSRAVPILCIVQYSALQHWERVMINVQAAGRIKSVSNVTLTAIVLHTSDTPASWWMLARQVAPDIFRGLHKGHAKCHPDLWGPARPPEGAVKVKMHASTRPQQPQWAHPHHGPRPRPLRAGHPHPPLHVLLLPARGKQELKTVCQITTLLQTRAEKDPRDRAEQWQPQTQNTVNAKLEAIRDSFTSFSSISEVNTWYSIW